MPRRIVLHAGFHKTGTSTVQQFLRQNRMALMPALAIRLKGQMPELMHAARSYSTWGDPITLAKVADRLDTLLAGLPGMPRRTLVLSGEELSGHMPGRRHINDYSAAVDLAKLYTEVIGAHFPEAELAFYFTTRNPDTWRESAYWEHVKSASMTLDFEDYVDRYPDAADLQKTVEAVRAAIPHDVHSASIDDGDTITPLLDLCGVPSSLYSDLPRPKASNTRPPKDVLLELLTANRAYPDRAARKAAKQDILGKVQSK